MRRKLARARKHVGDQRSELGVMPQGQPVGGFTLWCNLPEGLDSATLARACLALNRILAPGNGFSPTQNATNVAQTAEHTLPVIGVATEGGLAPPSRSTPMGARCSNGEF
ncbi:hypothetical protein SAMN05444678_11950 [Sphingomonas sp. YR710]|uniref:hypothetical protein n=1 Tax=Sphingomonas sp. YR710 TaxID=1882773 RepID=UPI0008835D8E|nr:hypothetical protein [Sphingomonas sp. YR710]SDD69678.1 hypothetical protein SAMN05444678_11950 [Sphingomonas sp. YR710]